VPIWIRDQGAELRWDFIGMASIAAGVLIFGGLFALIEKHEQEYRL
jgi:hypothetical protein